MSPIAVDTIHEPVTTTTLAAEVDLKGKKTKSDQTLDGLSDDPLERTFRGNKEGTLKLPTRYPDFKGDKYAERQWVKEHLAAAFQYWAKCGFAEGVSGHITYRDPVLPDHYWMNPFSMHFGMITVSDLVLVTPEGYVSEHGAQLPINTAGFHIHSAIHHARPDIKAAAHCHSLHGKAWSVFGKAVDCLTQDACLFYDNQGVYSNFGGLVLAQEEGENIAKAMGPKFRTCILQNHGLLTAGDTVDECVYYFAALDRMCRAQLLVEAARAGNPDLKKEVIDPADAQFTATTLQNPENVYVNFQPEYNMLVHEKGSFFLK